NDKAPDSGAPSEAEKPVACDLPPGGAKSAEGDATRRGEACPPRKLNGRGGLKTALKASARLDPAIQGSSVLNLNSKDRKLCSCKPLLPAEQSRRGWPGQARPSRQGASQQKSAQSLA